MADVQGPARLLLTTDAVGGVWTYSLDLARSLGGLGTETVLAVMGPEPDAKMLAAARAIPGVSVVNTGLPLDWLAERREQVADAARALAGLAAEWQCDSVQLHSAALAAGVDFRCPVVAVHHSCLATWWQAVRTDEEMPREIAWQVQLVAEGLSAADAVVAPTTAMAHAVADSYRLDHPPLVIRNGRAPPAAARDDAAQRAPFVLTSGRLWDEGKDLATLARAAVHIPVPMLAAGATAPPLGTGKDVPNLRLLGSLGEEEMRLWLSQAPVYASAARYEPFGLGVLEAAQAGCALVLSDIPSLRELWSGACLFVARGDEAGFAAAIAQLFADPALLRRLSARALRRAAQFTPEGMARDMARLHGNLIVLDRVGRGAAA